MAKRKAKPKNEKIHTENQKLNSGQAKKGNGVDKKKKGTNANEKLVKSNTKNQKPSCPDKKKKSVLSVNNQDTAACLLGYKKKDLAEVNYFVLKKNNKQPDHNLTETVQIESFSEGSCQNAQPTKSFWNRSLDKLESDFKQIMIEERKQHKQQLDYNENGDFSRKSNSTICLQDDKSSNQQICWGFQFLDRALSLEEKSTCQYLRREKDGYGCNYASSTNDFNEHKFCQSETLTDRHDRKYSLGEFLLEPKGKSKTQANKKSENDNEWINMKLEQEERYPPLAVETWLQDNEVCFDQIMLEEKIKRRVATEKTRGKIQSKAPKESDIPSGETVKQKHGEYTQRSISYHDKTDIPQKDLRMPSRKYSFDHLLQSDCSSEISYDHHICLDQIIIEEKIKRKLRRTKQCSETSSEDTYFTSKRSIPVTNIIKLPALLQSLMIEFKLYNIALSNVPYLLTKLDKTSEEFNDVSCLFFKSVHTYKIHCIKKVVNPYLLLHYNLKKATAGGVERTLFHGTKIENLDPICTENFDWRQVRRHKYGWGVSFSNSAYYASHYSDQSALTMVMFVVKVLVGLEWFGECDTEVPEEPYDTTMNLDGKVYVKFDDCCFYPAYVIFYKHDFAGKARK